MDTFLQIDQSIFLFINQGLSNSIFDFVLPMLRDKLVWVPVYVFILSIILFNNRWQTSLYCVLLVAATMTLSDTMSSKIIKPSVERVRPCNDLQIQDDIILRARCGRGYSFTSSHATNHFSLATILFLLLGPAFKWRGLLFLWAGLIAFSQVYVGVHYPADILVGALLGIILAYSAFWLFEKIKNSMLENRDDKAQ